MIDTTTAAIVRLRDLEETCGGKAEPWAVNHLVSVLVDAQAHIAWLERALEEALEGWQDNAAYKIPYLREKHGDNKAIADLRKALKERTKLERSPKR